MLRKVQIREGKMVGAKGFEPSTSAPELWQMNFILIALLMFQKSLLHHALPELRHGCRAETMERRDGPVSRDPMGDRPPRVAIRRAVSS
jgi:hypothetical protein